MKPFPNPAPRPALSRSLGPMASFYADQDIDRLEQSSDEDFLHPLYEDLVGERNRRRIISLSVNP